MSCSTNWFFAVFGLRHTEHVNDLIYSVERLNSLVNAARVDLESFKARERHHRRGTSIESCNLESFYSFFSPPREACGCITSASKAKDELFVVTKLSFVF